MKRTALLLLLLTLRYGAQAAVDFTAAESIREQDGITFPELIFHQDGHKITYEAPRGWSHSGGGSEIRFTPPALSQAQATIEQSPLITSQAFDDATVKLLQQKMIESIPTGSTNVKIVSEEKNPLTPNGYDTYELLVSYENYGHAFTASTLFLNMPDTQLRFRVTARTEDFDKVYGLFRRSLYSWQWL